MLNSVKEHPHSDKSLLAQWIARTLRLTGGRVKFRLRGNNLHILCEASPCPERAIALQNLLLSLKKTDLNQLLPPNHPAIYHVLIYGREPEQRQPTWVANIHLDQLDRYLEYLRQAQPSPPELSAPEFSPAAATSIGDRGHAAGRRPGPEAREQADEIASGGLILSNKSQARQGQPGAIARYLSETLSRLGVAVNVTVKMIPYQGKSPAQVQAGTAPVAEFPPPPSGQHPSRRLWITCEATYSPDPFLIAEPVAQKLRQLELKDFKDALVLVQVRGEAKPDWALRVDLTPRNEMLREWGRWGDVQALTRLLDQVLNPHQVMIASTSQNSTTLHVFCQMIAAGSGAEQPTAPSQEIVRNAVTPLLETLGPQGIHAVTIYGQIEGQDAPHWVHWIELPASHHAGLADAPVTLAQQGDWGAIAFLLNRLLNPDLDQQLATGGIRIQLLPRGDLLHVMSDGPTCPDQRQVGSAITGFLKQLRLAKIAGVRVYGRRAGQKRPLWSYGVDLTTRDRLVLEATPEFAATDAYVGDLIGQPGDLVLRPDLTPAQISNLWDRLWQGLVYGLQRSLVRSQFFVYSPEIEQLAAEQTGLQRGTAIRLALIWAAVGGLLVVQADWLLGRSLRAARFSTTMQTGEPLSATVSAAEPPEAGADGADVDQEPGAEMPLPDMSLNQTSDDANDAFNDIGFTQPGRTQINLDAPPADFSDPAEPSGAVRAPAALPYTKDSLEMNPATAALLVANSPYPTFNSRLMDQKLALYYQRLEESGPPDVLIVGSSRALRGVDPTALQQSLAGLGYRSVDVFNFGVNGATAQVVDLILQQVLTPEQLPKLILWADGARALNSGRVDVTYNGMAVSEGYQELASGRLPMPEVADTALAGGAGGNPTAAGEGLGASLSASYRAIDRWLSQRLGGMSAVYAERDRLKSAMQNQVSWLLPNPESPSSTWLNPTAGLDVDPDGLPQDGQAMVDFDGFLPLPLQFNPATYYQQFARVSGDYDRDYESFQLEGKQAQALESILQFSQRHSIPIVFVNLPLTDEYLDPIRSAYEQEFKQYMLDISLQNRGFIFRDLGPIWTANYDYFSDPSHLNRYGAYAVSARLAQDPMIPWSGVEAGE